jgi:hypothetical protein
VIAGAAAAWCAPMRRDLTRTFTIRWRFGA